ncbi:DUF2946 family protein [Roseomonas elaeocarpi]|uniref:DUF2946 family protein n=1 Tax=Roseomonas elaeocarpi TaxID=907779 RepID=A0ABV6JP50_9PROT
MSRPARSTLALLALLLLVQWGGGLLPHLRAMAAEHVGHASGQTVIICSPTGLRTIRLDDDGKPARPSPPLTACCTLCQGPMAGAELSPPPALPAPSVTLVSERGPGVAGQVLFFRPPPRTLHPRAPPGS